MVFFYNLKTNKITCFSCETEHDTSTFNLKHASSCKHKEKNIPLYVDENFEDNASSFKSSSTKLVKSLSSSTEFPKKLDMKKECDRLQTFISWDKNVPVKPKDLAHNGFYFKGFADVVVCAYCMLELRNWEKGDDVKREHMRHSPKCSILETALDLSDSTSVSNMKYETYRLKSFSHVSSSFAVCTKTLAKNGFYFIGLKDEVCCISCKCKLSNWKKEDNIRQRHQNESPSCPFVLRTGLASLTHPSNIILDRPKHPQFALITDRLKTFTNWSSVKKQTPELLAEAGFYHTGKQNKLFFLFRYYFKKKCYFLMQGY